MKTGTWSDDALKTFFGKLQKTAESITRKSIADKLDKYLLNKKHPVGGSKADWFEKAPAKAVFQNNNGHGDLYQQIITITGANGKKIDVPFNFIIKMVKQLQDLLEQFPLKSKYYDK